MNNKYDINKYSINYNLYECVKENEMYEEQYEHEKEYYEYLRMLEKMYIIVKMIRLEELEEIMNTWKPEECVRYFYRIIERISNIS
ncbi:hypothetical protein EAI30_14180 [Romboutsia ilealis]|uniref:Uncharacterized protein n=1 Tax=Romboutsia faecis TaxID=2764597 RepID=A0ABR7JTA0_9FIRM|nr:hypothetical protein [Romboutsia faecis]MBC5998148.1 hypothetical protein [Romboutsia faecis]MRN25769.1 hypothetical protein [Romboutsia ilealis]